MTWAAAKIEMDDITSPIEVTVVLRAEPGHIQEVRTTDLFNAIAHRLVEDMELESGGKLVLEELRSQSMRVKFEEVV